jgi:hypothetical protein
MHFPTFEQVAQLNADINTGLYIDREAYFNKKKPYHRNISRPSGFTTPGYLCTSEQNSENDIIIGNTDHSSHNTDTATATNSTTSHTTESLIHSFVQSMWSRLALSIHAAMINGASLCETDTTLTHTDELPPCLQHAIRFQHMGCDFHVDSSLTGGGSRLFECNKGPDMSTHSLRDGVMKRKVAADIMSFIGLTGVFDGSAESARRFNMTLIYDSNQYYPEQDLLYLHHLKADDHIREVQFTHSARDDL